MTIDEALTVLKTLRRERYESAPWPEEKSWRALDIATRTAMLTRLDKTSTQFVLSVLLCDGRLTRSAGSNPARSTHKASAALSVS